MKYQMNPYYQFKNASKQIANDAASAKQAEIITKLKALGVKDGQIEVNVDSYQDYKYSGVGSQPEDYIYNLRIIVTVPDRSFAQKIQDYIATTEPEGTVTPYPNFSEAKRKELEAKARDIATRDARGKA